MITGKTVKYSSYRLVIGATVAPRSRRSQPPTHVYTGRIKGDVCVYVSETRAFPPGPALHPRSVRPPFVTEDHGESAIALAPGFRE